MDSRKPHAMSRYARVTEAVIDKLQHDYRAGRDLGKSVPEMSERDAAVIVVESLEADRLVQTSLDELAEQSVEPKSDWAVAVFAEMLFAMADHLRERGVPRAKSDRFESLAWRALGRALNSPTASPLLWYQDIYLSVAQEYRLQHDVYAIELLQRGLVHDLHHYDGENATAFLLNLAECHLWLDKLDGGLSIYAALLENDPADVFIYNSIALVFNQVGLAGLGVDAIQRALQLVDVTGDPEELRDQLAGCLDDMRRSAKRGREAELDEDVLADFRAALTRDFEAGRHLPINELAREVVPDIDQLPIKGPPEMPDLPSPEAVDLDPRSDGTGIDLGRNEPCWCGSGKKYKHCHMRSDQAG